MGNKIWTCSLSLLLSIIFCLQLSAQEEHSMARVWNEALLTSIRNDFARPTIHARNLHTISAAMYDAWAVYDEQAEPYFLGKEHDGLLFEYDEVEIPMDVKAAQEEAIAYASYRMLRHRFRYSPNAIDLFQMYDSLLLDQGFDFAITSVDYSDGSAAKLGNFIAERLISFGQLDGSREQWDYESRRYYHSNDAMIITNPGNPNLRDPNKWQPLSLAVIIDQSGNERPGGITFFLSPEWGETYPFALTDDELDIYDDRNYDWHVYYDPGPPPYINVDSVTTESEFYKWGFSMVSSWSSHLDPYDGVMIDISPANLGNIGDVDNLPTTFEGFKDFYSFDGTSIPDKGWNINPKTGAAYESNIVPRGDFARVLAEFWADGPDSETPPGHWFVLLNEVSDHPGFERRFEGLGDEIDPLEWDVKSYMAMGGAMHDAAIAAWGIKGYYDYLRPVSAIRWLCDQGQSSDPDKPSYDPIKGIPLVDGLIDVVQEGDTLAGFENEHVGKIKVYSWRGPDYITTPDRYEMSPDSAIAGVDWILAENWWPYQRPTFVTPPFAGYISGHSTYSRAAAEVMTKLTGDPYFPGGLGEFTAPKDEYLVFEQGPSQDITLQWATYRDAAAQSGLSRIWGGIHPPVDDIPGRIIGEKIGKAAFDKAALLFDADYISATDELDGDKNLGKVFPNPVSDQDYVSLDLNEKKKKINWSIYSMTGELLNKGVADSGFRSDQFKLDIGLIPSGTYVLKLVGDNLNASQKIIVQR